MILVDTSVLIDFFKGVFNSPAKRLREVLVEGIPFAITSVIYQEVLQGAKSEKEFALFGPHCLLNDAWERLRSASTRTCQKFSVSPRSTFTR